MNNEELPTKEEGSAHALLTAEEVAKHMRCSADTINRNGRRGTLKGFRRVEVTNRIIRYAPDALSILGGAAGIALM